MTFNELVKKRPNNISYPNILNIKKLIEKINQNYIDNKLFFNEPIAFCFDTKYGGYHRDYVNDTFCVNFYYEYNGQVIFKININMAIQSHFKDDDVEFIRKSIYRKNKIEKILQ